MFNQVSSKFSDVFSRFSLCAKLKETKNPFYFFPSISANQSYCRIIELDVDAYIEIKIRYLFLVKPKTSECS